MDEVAVKYPGLQHQPGDSNRWGGIRRALRTLMRAQFGRPSGILGTIVGTIMANAPSNQDRIRWTIAQLDLQSHDRVLEIGFGPGYAVKEACKILQNGFFAGVDHSAVMVRQATKRNSIAVRKGIVDLRHGSVSNLPAYSEPFNKIFTINSIHFWTDPIARLAELRELMQPGGMIAVTLQPRSRGSSSDTTDAIGKELVANLGKAGFRQVRLETRPASPAPIACAIGFREMR